MRGRLGVVAAGVLLTALLWGCTPGPEEVRRARDDLAARAANAVHDDLEGVVRRLQATSAGAEEALARAGDEPLALFRALDRLRAAHGVDGVLWEGPGGERAWSGHALEAPSLPPERPWSESFRALDLGYHAGPYLRALVLGPVMVRGGVLTVTQILEERRPGGSGDRPFRARWLDPLDVAGVRILPPSSTETGCEGAQAFLVRMPSGEPVLRAVIQPPGEPAVEERLEEQSREVVGVVGIAVGIVLLFVLLRLLGRTATGSIHVGLGTAAIALALREWLALLDLPGRFAFLERAFSPADFGVEDPLGWLASPGDFALSALAVSVAAAGLFWASRTLRRPRSRALSGVGVLGGLGVAAVAPALWVAVVELAVTQGQTDVFAAPSIVPSLPAALLLVALVAATSAFWIFVRAGLETALRSAGLRDSRAATCIAAGLAAGGAILFALGTAPLWAPLLLPLTVLPFLLARPPDERVGFPTRVVLAGVVSTALLFPVLWQFTSRQSVLDLSAVVDDLVRSEATAQSATLLDLRGFAEDAELRRALEAARNGPKPDGLAFELWLRSFLAGPHAHGLVSVLDPQGRRLDDFTLIPLPLERIPAPAPPAAGQGDLQVVVARSEAGHLRAIVGRLRVRDQNGRNLGTVVFTVPDKLDLLLLGIGEGLGTGGSAPARRSRFPVEVALLEGGRVTASSDPSISRRPGAFGPEALAQLGPKHPEMAWKRPGEEGYALWSWERGATIAVRRRTPDTNDLILALARVVMVGVGMAGIVAAVGALAGWRHHRPRLHNRLLLSYFLISFIPILILGWASARDARSRHDVYLAQRLETDIRRARSDLEAMGPQVFDQASDPRLVRWAGQRGHDVFLYREGLLVATSRAGLVEAELLPARLPPDAYRATVIEKRELVRREASFAGQPVWFGYAPVLDSAGRVLATVGVPLLYDKDRVEERFAVTGSVLFAAYLLTLVLVLVGAIWAARRLTHPIGLLANGTRRVAAGELDVEIEAVGGDELAELVRAFNAMTRELKELTARAVRAERDLAWQRMARQVAHEIKNPLTPMRLMIQQMQADVARDPANAQEAIRRTAPVVLKQIETLGRIAGDFAHFARLPRRNPTAIDIAQLVREVVQLYAGNAATGVVVAAKIGEGDDLPRVRWDAEELRRVLVNLVGNAVQAIEGEGSVEVRVRRDALAGRLGVRVEVADTGRGIQPEHRARLFEPDFSTRTGGTGLGLAMVRRTLDDLGGTIEVESEPGVGSTFRMWWPAEPTPGPPRES